MKDLIAVAKRRDNSKLVIVRENVKMTCHIKEINDVASLWATYKGKEYEVRGNAYFGWIEI